MDIEIRIGARVSLQIAIAVALGFGSYLVAAAQDKAPTVFAIAISAAGERAAITSPGSLVVAKTASGATKHFGRLPAGVVTVMALSKDGQKLAAGGVGPVTIWESDRGMQTQSLAYDKAVASMAFSDDTTLLATGTIEGEVAIWDLTSDAPPKQAKSNTNSIAAIAFSPDGNYLAAASWDKTVTVWDVKTLKLLATCKGHTNWVNALTFDSTSSRLASGGNDGLINIWDVPTGKLIASATNGSYGIPMGIDSVAFSRDGKEIIAVGIGKGGRWDPVTGKRVGSFDNPGFQSKIASSTDGKHLLLISHDGSVYLIDPSGQDPAQHIPLLP